MAYFTQYNFADYLADHPDLEQPGAAQTPLAMPASPPAEENWGAQEEELLWQRRLQSSEEGSQESWKVFRVGEVERGEEEDAVMADQIEEDGDEEEDEEESAREDSSSEWSSGWAQSELDVTSETDLETSSGHPTTDSLLTAQSEEGSEKSASVHRQLTSSRQAHNSKTHSCCTDSIWESDTSYWDTSRDHDMEAEIVFAYDLPNIPRNFAELPEQPTSFYELEDHPGELPPIDAEDFARAFRQNRQYHEQQVKHWRDRIIRRGAANWQRTKLHIAYIQKREARRKAREDKKKGRSPSHEERRLQKKRMRIRQERERMDRSIEEKGMDAWEREHCDPEMKEAVKEERRKLYGWSVLP